MKTKRGLYKKGFDLLMERTAKAQSQSELGTTDALAGLSYLHESYQETADRLKEEGDDDGAALYEAMEKRWFEFG